MQGEIDNSKHDQEVDNAFFFQQSCNHVLGGPPLLDLVDCKIAQGSRPTINCLPKRTPPNSRRQIDWSRVGCIYHTTWTTAEVDIRIDFLSIYMI
jgi:hypothetical protein